MAYRIETFPISEKLEYLEQNENYIYHQIWMELERLSVYFEGLKTGSPEKLRGFQVGSYRVFYRVDHPSEQLFAFDIREIPPS